MTARVAQGMMSLCESSQKSFTIGHVVVWCSFDSVPSCVFFTFHLADNTSDLSSATNWNQTKPCAVPLGDGLSGRLAGPIPNTGYEPMFCIDVHSEHNLPSRDMSFQQEHDATIASEDLILPRHFVASSSSQHSAANIVPTLSKLGSVGTCSRKTGCRLRCCCMSYLHQGNLCRHG